MRPAGFVPEGVIYRFAGAYENQVRAAARLRVLPPPALAIIFLILYFRFRSVVTSSIVLSGVLIAWCGGFLLLRPYGQPGFLDVDLLGVNLCELFQVRAVNLSVAVWVGFLALFGIATDDGVVQAALLRQTFARRRPDDVGAVRAAAHEAG